MTPATRPANTLLSNLTDNVSVRMHTALMSGNATRVLALVDEVFPAQTGVLGQDLRRSWFMAAAQASTPEVLHGMLRHGSATLLPDKHGRIALHKASLGNVQTLMDLGLDINARDYQETTPLSLLCKNFQAGPQDSLGLLHALLRHGADPGAADDKGNSPLISLMRIRPNTGNRRAAFEALLAAGADVHHKDCHGGNVLMHVTIGGHGDLLEPLLKAGARCASPVFMRAAAAAAVKKDCPSALEALRAQGLDLTSDPDQLLHLAFENKAPGAALWLLEAGADPLAATHEGHTVAMQAKTSPQCFAVLQSFLVRRAACEAIVSMSPGSAGRAP